MKTPLFLMISAAFFVGMPAVATAQQAQIPGVLQQALQKSVDANPEVQNQWHAFKRSENQQDGARGGYLPSIDLNANAGREKKEYPHQSSDSYNRRGIGISLTQMLYDGFYTRSEVARLGHSKLTNYFSLLNEVENISLETLSAYVDVLRYKELVQEAKDNYVEHKLVYDQIVERTRAGIGRGVDLEQAAARLALAESNLLTEAANLHDVNARYVRLVGEQPQENLPALDMNMLSHFVPQSKPEVLNIAFAENPGLKMTQANIRSSQAAIDSVRSAFHPKFDLRASQNNTHNKDDIRGNTKEGVIQVVMNYNLYRGGADSARLREAAENLNVSRDLREKMCRDLRQTVSIAYNDVQQLAEQLAYLDQHRLSIGKAREAYRQQFEIGQRSLLDLLDTENEYFDARRAYTNGSYNKMLAEARSLVGMGQLLRVLGVVRADLPAVSALAEENDYVDPASLCPVDAPEMIQVNKKALIEDAMRSGGRNRPRR